MIPKGRLHRVTLRLHIILMLQGMHSYVSCQFPCIRTFREFSVANHLIAMLDATFDFQTRPFTACHRACICSASNFKLLL
jgi:hypothetical protein